jgi:hypothetical protein
VKTLPGLSNYGAGSQLNLGTQPKNRPKPEAPVEEHVHGYVNPYRGLESHGVEPKEHWVDVPEDDDELREYHEEKPEPDPIAVRVVSAGSEQLKLWNVRREIAITGGGSNRILGQDKTRTKAYIKNIGTAAIYISPDPISNSQLGYPIAANVEFIYDQQGDVWAMTDDAANQPIALLVEYAVAEG